jgi:hypothetical protein
MIAEAAIRIAALVALPPWKRKPAYRGKLPLESLGYGMTVIGHDLDFANYAACLADFMLQGADDGWEAGMLIPGKFPPDHVCPS